ncbi:hypothetical protein [Actinoplanes flavus]|uniref:HEAT repeat domain-containing protein n=1 Tax=Actinoplanes flavus TaxID=2820290 RepID=A0ABS3UIH8_9ACTN|nr:hypothetical protein [Actinoplanes flavus]MBO3738575.1 hypothetical protein [Actinoplanes flavus]
MTVDWSRLRHANGSATDTPGHLHALEHGDASARAAALDHFEYTVLHGNFPETATAPVVRHLTILLSEDRIHTDDIDAVVEFLGNAAFSATQLDNHRYHPADLNDLAEAAATAHPVVLALTEAHPTHLRAHNLARIAQLPQLADRRDEVIACLHRWSSGDDGDPEPWLYYLGLVGADVRDRLTDPHPAVRLRAALIHEDDPHARALILNALAEPTPAGVERCELVEAAIRLTDGFDDIAEPACRIAAEENWTAFDMTWGPLLSYAFPEPYSPDVTLTPAQRAFLHALADNDRLWQPRNGSCSLRFRDAGLPYDQHECRHIAS